jgi:predicted transcriptional regulator
MAEKVKFSVSLDAELGEALRQCAEAEDQQISAVVSRALEQYLDHRRVIREGLRAMDEYFDEHGWPTTEEQAEAQAWVDDLFRDEHREQHSA